MSENDMVLAEFLTEHLGRPQFPHAAPPADIAAWEAMGLRAASAFFGAMGLGGYKGGHLTVCGPSLLAEAVAAITLCSGRTLPTQPVLGYFGAFGAADMTFEDGSQLTLDPLNGQAYLVRPETPGPPITAMIEAVFQFSGAMEDLKDTEILTLEQKSLFAEAKRRLGRPAYGSIYTVEGVPAISELISPENLVILPIATVLGRVPEWSFVETTIADNPEDLLPPGEAWGDDWDDDVD